jgi:uncharacterized membrane protein YkvA (DUF1232 family)
LRVLLVFVDGIGIGPPEAHNPFAEAPVRVLAPLAEGQAGDERVAMTALDAALGHPGLPQSATGQATIFTGEDAIAVAGGHREGYPTRAVGEVILRGSVLAKVRAAGGRAAFLNAFDRERGERIARIARGEEKPVRGGPKPSASALAGLAAGGELRTMEDAEAGRAVTFDFTGEVMRAFGVDAPARSIEQAAGTLASAASELDLALFETFLTDKAGHAQDMTWARHEIARLERFLRALFDAVDPSEQLVVVTSDHGNLEDLSTRSHTLARVPLMAFGAGAADFVRGARSILDVAPRLLIASSVMTDAALDPKFLELFPQWLRSLGEDASGVCEALGLPADGAGEFVPDDASRALISGLNYIFKSLDLIPDGIDDLGFLDDAFVLRVACAIAAGQRPGDKKPVVQRLADDARAVHEFLGDDYARLETYVRGLRKGAARGRTVEDIVLEESTRKEFATEVRAWSAAYQVPSFTRDPKTLVKLKAFLNAKLP